MDSKKYTAFISDTHFNEDQPATLERFIDFLRLNKTSLEALYLLGDIFDAWIGDDYHSDLIHKVSTAIVDCSNAGTKIYFIHGNRDYLIGEKFAQDCGMTLVGDPYFVLLYGKPTLLMHGDLLCTDDHSYQRYRKIMFAPWMKKLCLLLPLSWRKKIASHLRALSQASLTKKSSNIMDVAQESVVDALEMNHAQWLIHGHTHRPGQHEVKLAHHMGYRLVLGAWSNDEGNAIIACQDQAPRLITFSASPKI